MEAQLTSFDLTFTSFQCELRSANRSITFEDREPGSRSQYLSILIANISITSVKVNTSVVDIRALSMASIVRIKSPELIKANLHLGDNDQCKSEKLLQKNLHSKLMFRLSIPQ